MLWTIFVILLVLWLLGFSFHVAGGLDSFPARSRSHRSYLQPDLGAAPPLKAHPQPVEFPPPEQQNGRTSAL